MQILNTCWFSLKSSLLILPHKINILKKDPKLAKKKLMHNKNNEEKKCCPISLQNPI
jgi:hypothetical protein